MFYQNPGRILSSTLILVILSKHVLIRMYNNVCSEEILTMFEEIGRAVFYWHIVLEIVYSVPLLPS